MWELYGKVRRVAMIVMPRYVGGVQFTNLSSELGVGVVQEGKEMLVKRGSKVKG